ncbi:malonic semialdehyde reductase [Tomitella biformata]|uniref:malonic semialdehyde reductase n=1 Tax=Tomitella biformata TaxID=630403 RepID=UPI000465F331|nr:malonic semialdehyde reductase [Tomitella biformata]
MTEVLDTTTSAARLPQLDESALATLFGGARTANSFADTPVSDELLEAIWAHAKWAPTAANTQPLRVLYVRPGAGRDRLVSHMSEGNQAKTAGAPAVAVLAVDTEFHEFIPQVFPINPGMKDFLAGNDEVRGQMAQMNSALQAGYFILAVRALGLAAGPMTGFDNAGLDADFFPVGRLRSLMVVNIGHPAENAWFDRLPRLDAADTVSWA